MSAADVIDLAGARPEPRVRAAQRMPRLSIPQQLLVASGVAYAASFGLLLAFWQPGRGIGATLYLAIVLAAMATGPGWGAAAGTGGAVVYWAGLMTGFDRPLSIVFSGAGVIHLLTFALVGATVGYFARKSRRMLSTTLHVLEDLLELAGRDVVTATANASAFEAAAADRLRTGRPFALLVGTSPDGARDGEGDLREIAALLRAQIGVADLVARTGPSEFALLVACPDPRRAPELALRLERALAHAGRPLAFGWATAADGDSTLELYAAAARRRDEQRPPAACATVVDLASRR